MPIRRVHRPVVTVEPEIVALQCNVCGVEEPRQVGGELPYDLHVVELGGGWGDDFPGDLETITFVVHGRCLKAWCDTFRIPVETRHAVGNVPPVHAIHSETGKFVILQWGWVRDAERPFVEPGIGADDTYELPYSDCIPAPGIYEHFKGMLYEAFAHGWDTEAPHEAYVVYRALYGDSLVYARPARIWSETVSSHNGNNTGPRFAPFKIP